MAGVLIVALALGLLLRSTTEDSSREVSGGGLVVQVPDSLIAGETPDGVVLTDRLGIGSEMHIRRWANSNDPGVALRQLDNQYAENLTLYDVTGEMIRKIGDLPGLQLSYVFVDPVPSPPSVLIGRDVSWMIENEVVTASLRAPVEQFESSAEVFEDLITEIELVER